MTQDAMSEKPWWFPTLTNDEWIAQIRAEYPDDTQEKSDNFIREYYAYGCKYVDTWDNLGDAREEYEKLADAYLDLLAKVGEV